MLYLSIVILIPCSAKGNEQFTTSKCACSHLGFCIFVMFSTFRDEMQYIFLEKNVIFMVFLAVKDAETGVI